MKKQKFSIKRRLLSFKYAFNGLKILISEEHNARIHLVMGVIAVIMGFLFKISLTEWMFLLLVIGIVIIMETVNSAIENLCDIVCPDMDDRIKRIKDLSALAVLLSVVIAVGVGLIIFLPKILISVMD